MAVTKANVAAGSLSSNTATIPDDLAQQALAAITLALLDIQNQRAVFEADEQSDVTVTFTDGSTYSGPGFRRIAYLAENGDVKKLANIGLAVQANQAAAEAAQVIAEAAAATASGAQSAVAASATAAAIAASNAQASETAAKASETTATSAAASSLSLQTAAEDSAKAAAASAAEAKASETNARTSEVNAKTSETNAANSAAALAASLAAAATSASNAQSSASIAAAAQAETEDARDTALIYSDSANTSRNEAAATLATVQGLLATTRTEANRAKTEADRAGNASKFTNAINVDDVTNVVDFIEPPTVNGSPISTSLLQGGFQLNTDLMCTTTDDLNDAAWQGQTFMLQKPDITGTAAAPVASNNGPSRMVYDYAICSDFYAGWTIPNGGTDGKQRVQMVYDQEAVWIRGYHHELGQWTNWKKIASQLKTDITGLDLNTTIDSGNYSFKNAINAPVIDASEASTIYFLDVFATDDGTNIIQVVRSPKTNSRFDRYLVNGTWSRWWNSTATFDVDTAAAGVDLNSITNPGWWGIPLDTAKNLPNGTAYPPSKTGQGILEVIGISNGATIQRMHYVDDGDVYYRYRVASNGNNIGAWSAWLVEFHFSENRVLPIANGGTGATTAAAARANLGLGYVKSEAGAGILTAPAGDNAFVVKDNNTWGVFSASKNSYLPLGIQQGGTGAANAYDALTNLGIPGIGKQDGASAPGGGKDANTIRANGIYAGGGDGSLNWFQGYSPLLHLSRYRGGVGGQFQIISDGRAAVRGTPDGGTTWSPWKELVKVDDYGVGSVTAPVLANKCGFIAEGSGASTWAPSNGAGVQSQYANTRIAQMFVDNTGKLHSRFITNSTGSAAKTAVPWNAVAHQNTEVSFKGINASGNVAVTGAITAGGTFSAGSIELSADTPYIDFHAKKSTTDYTNRLITSTSGTLQLAALQAYARFDVIGGIGCRSGIKATQMGANQFNINFVSGRPKIIIDNTDFGFITTTATATSDRLLKKDINYCEPNAGALDEVMQWKPATFKYIARGVSPESTEQLGIIANDLVKVSPDCVEGEGLKPGFDPETPDGAYVLKEIPMIIKLAQSIQELNQSLKDEVSSLRAELAELKAQK